MNAPDIEHLRAVALHHVREVLDAADEQERAAFLVETVTTFYDYGKFSAVPGGGGLDGNRDGERGSLNRVREEADAHRERVEHGFPDDPYAPGEPGL